MLKNRSAEIFAEAESNFHKRSPALINLFPLGYQAKKLNSLLTTPSPSVLSVRSNGRHLTFSSINWAGLKLMPVYIVEAHDGQLL